jgi:hypothetical protein
MGELQFYQRNLQRRRGVSTQPWATPWEETRGTDTFFLFTTGSRGHQPGIFTF